MKQQLAGLMSCMCGYMAIAYTGSAEWMEEYGSRCLGDSERSRRSTGLSSNKC